MDAATETGDDRYLVISCDCHAQGRPEDYRAYVEGAHLDDFDEWARTAMRPGREGRERMAEMMAAAGGRHPFGSVADRFAEHEAVLAGGEDGLFDFERRIKELEDDGIVGDVVIGQGIPFGEGGLIPSAKAWDWPTRKAGIRAANRWLADRCSSNPGRHAGLAVVPDMDDIDASAAELESLFDAGLRGGIMLPDSPAYEWPAWNHPRYTPLWEFLDHHGLPVHTHLGSIFGGPHGDNTGEGAREINVYENHFRASRPFWCMYFGRVFERYPNLKFSFTEHGVEWIPQMIREMMVSYYKGLEAFAEHLVEVPAQWEGHDLKPDEVWARQGYAGASFMAKGEAEHRDDIGVDRIMWGSDYPHVEGTWPNTRQRLRRVLQNVPVADKRKILGENALHCYTAAFDGAHLRAEAARTGLLTTDV